MRPSRRLVLGATSAVLAAGGVLMVAACGQSTAGDPAAARTDPPSTTAPARTPRAPGHRSDRGRLSLRTTFGGDISPKSVAASGTGLVFAQNMMYRHSVTVYDARRLRLRKTIPDTVRLSRLGYPEYRGEQRGAPVEAAFSPDGSHAYVSNYSMYGPGFGPEGHDECSPSSGYDRSFVYRIRLDRLTIDRAYRVGPVPKVVAVSRDGAYVLVSNWCGYDVSVVSTRRGRQVRSIPIGPYPRGIAVSPTRDVAYVAQMGGTEIVRVDLTTWRTRRLPIGLGPRAVVVGPAGKVLFATLNAEGRVARLDLRTGAVTKVSTGSAPRSLAIAADGRALYVVNYESGTVSKLRASDLHVMQTIPACPNPIGITYEPVTHRVWVACYGGQIRVYDDR
ncbi:MAG TPA: YncE family protein [Miltoncostaeaceae bacterium]|nr:YncE family protein [Miltoncostaeaceae bacterium]